MPNNINQDCNFYYHFLVLFTLLVVITVTICLILINRRPRYRLKITTVANHAEAKTACKILRNECEKFPVLGFDAEWVTTGRKRQPVALIQLCASNGTCALFRLCKLKHFPEELEDLLADRSILKVGVAPMQDKHLLYNDYGVTVNGTLDLRHVFATQFGLGFLAEKHLGLHLNKNMGIRCSNWEAPRLKRQQAIYAAMDAYAGLEIFTQWTRRWYGTKKLYQLEADFKQYIDQPFKQFGSYSMSKSGLRMERIRKWPSRYCTIQKDVIYDKCVMEAPDGKLLCTIKKSKVEWYVKRNRAIIVAQDPLTIRLLFEPKKQSEDNQYVKEFKKDQCVVCGVTRKLLKHCVVPRMYSKHFPVNLKSHCSHDILLTCVACHLRADKLGEILKISLSEAAGANRQIASDKRHRRIRNVASNLIKHGYRMPETRKWQLQEEIKQYYGGEEYEFTTEFLQKIVEEKNDLSTGQIVIDHFINTGETIFSLQRLWRQYFVDNMAPKFLPKYWSIDHVN